MSDVLMIMPFTADEVEGHGFGCLCFCYDMKNTTVEFLPRQELGLGGAEQGMDVLFWGKIWRDFWRCIQIYRGDVH